MTLVVPMREKAADPAIDAVIALGRRAAARHWLPATSGNISVRIDNGTIAITRSGVDKGGLTAADVLIQPLDSALLPGSSAEALLHVEHYRAEPQTGSVVHIHGPHSAVIGEAHRDQGAVHLQGFELQKALSGVTSHETLVEVPVFANDQDMNVLLARLAARRTSEKAVTAPGFLLAGHGLYAFGRDAEEAFRHTEALETLFSQLIMLRTYQP